MIRRASIGVGLLASLCMLPASAGCGYALQGHITSLPAYITLIGVPPIVNKTSVFDIEQVFGQDLQAEWQSHGKFKVTSDDVGVDAVMRVTINTVSLQPVAYTGDRQASTQEIDVIASVEFVDTHTGKMLWQSPSEKVSGQYNITNSTSAGDVRAYFGQNTDALQRLAQTFAKQVVTAALENF